MTESINVNLTKNNKIELTFPIGSYVVGETGPAGPQGPAGPAGSGGGFDYITKLNCPINTLFTLNTFPKTKVGGVFYFYIKDITNNILMFRKIEVFNDGQGNVYSNYNQGSEVKFSDVPNVNFYFQENGANIEVLIYSTNTSEIEIYGYRSLNDLK